MEFQAALSLTVPDMIPADPRPAIARPKMNATELRGTNFKE